MTNFVIFVIFFPDTNPHRDTQTEITYSNKGPDLFLQDIGIDVAATGVLNILLKLFNNTFLFLLYLKNVVKSKTVLCFCKIGRSPAWPALVIVMNMIADNIPFCNLSKNAILAEGSCGNVSGATTTALNQAFKQLKKKFPLGFDGFADWRLRRAKEFDAPFVARHLANIVARSKNKTFTERIKTLLAEATSTSSSQESQESQQSKKRKLEENIDTQMSWIEPEVVNAGAGVSTEESDVNFLEDRELVCSQLTNLLLKGLDTVKRKDQNSVRAATNNPATSSTQPINNDEDEPGVLSTFFLHKTTLAYVEIEIFVL